MLFYSSELQLCLFVQDATGRTGELAPVEKGTIHTKRHSGEDPAKARSVLSLYIQHVYPTRYSKKTLTEFALYRYVNIKYVSRNKIHHIDFKILYLEIKITTLSSNHF